MEIVYRGLVMNCKTIKSKLLFDYVVTRIILCYAGNKAIIINRNRILSSDKEIIDSLISLLKADTDNEKKIDSKPKKKSVTLPDAMELMCNTTQERVIASSSVDLPGYGVSRERATDSDGWQVPVGLPSWNELFPENCSENCSEDLSEDLSEYD